MFWITRILLYSISSLLYFFYPLNNSLRKFKKESYNMCPSSPKSLSVFPARWSWSWKPTICYAVWMRGYEPKPRPPPSSLCRNVVYALCTMTNALNARVRIRDCWLTVAISMICRDWLFSSSSVPRLDVWWR